MAGLITELVNVLEEQTGYYSEMLTLSKEKKDHIIKNNIKEIQEVGAKENTLVGKMQKLDKKRLALISDIAVVLNRTESEITLNAIADVLKGRPEHEPLVKALSSIRAAADDLKAANDQNNILIKNALDYIDFSMNLIRSSFHTTPMAYSRKGEEIDASDSFFDAKQ